MSIQAILYRKGSNLVTIAPGASIRDAAGKLRDKNIAALVVTSGRCGPGADLRARDRPCARPPGERTCGLTVGEVMARDVVTIGSRRQPAGGR